MWTAIASLPVSKLIAAPAAIFGVDLLGINGLILITTVAIVGACFKDKLVGWMTSLSSDSATLPRLRRSQLLPASAAIAGSASPSDSTESAVSTGSATLAATFANAL